MADQLNQRVRTLVDAALDRVFAEPFDVRSAAELEDLMAAGPIGTGAGPAATSLGAFVAAATPLARRAFSVASKSSKVATKAPLPSSRAIKIGLASLPIALRLSTTTRHGVREIQLLASYVIARLRAAGVEPERGLVRSLTLSLYVDPARRPNLEPPGSRTAGAVARQWVLRSLGGDAESAVRARARREADALERLDLRELGRAWELRHGAIDV
ncbi:MAG TPA: hypothetical protein VIA11_00260 [Acidimicrobiia bacterium]|jgi:hypothetical protein|nr:hypothetical protein [Acidimicrobiia bacterium]